MYWQPQFWMPSPVPLLIVTSQCTITASIHISTCSEVSVKKHLPTNTVSSTDNHTAVELFKCFEMSHCIVVVLLSRKICWSSRILIHSTTELGGSLVGPKLKSILQVVHDSLGLFPIAHIGSDYCFPTVMLLVDKYRPTSLDKLDYHTELSAALKSLVRFQPLNDNNNNN